MEAHFLERSPQGVGTGHRRLCVHRCRQRQGGDGDLLDYQEGSGEAFPYDRKNLRERETNRQLAPKVSGLVYGLAYNDGVVRQLPIRVKIRGRSGDRTGRARLSETAGAK